ncbi:hypothetical protein ACF0H5_014242 [Mactra antiquata]
MIQEGVYKAKEVTVKSIDDVSYTCRTYYLTSKYLNETLENRPSPMYMDVIIKGARQNNIPDDYVRYLQSIETNGHLENDLKLYKDILKLLEND